MREASWAPPPGTFWEACSIAGCPRPSPGPRSLYEAIVQEARKRGLAGATVFRGFEGFGAHSRVHTARILRLSEDLPIVVEIVDTEEKIQAFLPALDEMVKEGLATVEKATVIFYRAGDRRPKD